MVGGLREEELVVGELAVDQPRGEHGAAQREHDLVLGAVDRDRLGLALLRYPDDLTERSGFVYLAHRVSDAVASKVTDLNLPGINLVPETQRVLPVGQLASPLVGTVNWAGQGASGLEYQYQSTLAGKAGSKSLLEAPDGVTLPGGGGTVASSPGTGLELTVDESVQYVAEQALAAEIVASHAYSGTAVVMDVKTGSGASGSCHMPCALA